MIDVAADDDLEQAIDDAEAGDVVTIAGVHAVTLVLKRTLTLRAAAEGAGLEGQGRGSLVKVEGEGVEVVLEGLTLSGGKAELGGALLVHRGARVVVRACRFEGNVASAKGGAIYVGGGELVIEGGVLSGNRAAQGGALHVEGRGRVRMLGTAVRDNVAARGAGISVHDGARVALVDVTATGQGGDGVDLRVRGTTSRAPSVEVQGPSLVTDAMPEDSVRVVGSGAANT